MAVCLRRKGASQEGGIGIDTLPPSAENKAVLDNIWRETQDRMAFRKVLERKHRLKMGGQASIDEYMTGE